MMPCVIKLHWWRTMGTTLYEPEHSQSAPPTVIIEDVLVRFIKKRHDCENTLSDFGNECFHSGPVLQFQQLQTTSEMAKDNI